MATIPLQLAQRRLDTGNVVSYPGGSPLGAAMQGFGDELSAVAERYRQQKEQQEAFDAEIVRRQFDGQIAQAENDATQNAPADGSGLHDSMYGQVDPRTGQVVKPGLFDTLFDGILPKIPESQRANFIKQKEILRAAGSARIAAKQVQRRQDYEQTELSTVLETNATAIAQSDPDDTITFEAARQDGLNLIDKMGLDPQIRQQIVKDWFSTTAKARFQALIAKDPTRALEMFGVVQPANSSGSDITQVAGAANASSGSSSAVALKGDGTGTAPIDAITYLAPGEVEALRNQANTANAAQLVDARAEVQLAEQNAPAVIATTGKYPEKKPTEQDFVNIYGAEEGIRHFQKFNITAGIAGAVFDMRSAPNQAIHAELRDFEPGPNGSPEEREQYEIKAGAAQLVLGARRADPVGYISQLFQDKAPDWRKVSTPDDYKTAVTWAVAAQQEMGFDGMLPLPWAAADQQAAKYIDQSVPFETRLAELSSIVLAVRDPDARKAMAEQISLAAEAQWRAKAAQDPNVTSELLEAQVAVLKNGLAWIGEHLAQAQYSTMPWLQQFGLAFSDVGRLTAKGAAAGGADAISAKLDSALSGGNYEDLLKNERAETEDAEDRAGSAGWAAEAFGAGLSGYGLVKGAIGLLGRAGIGAAAETGLTGIAARTGVGAWRVALMAGHTPSTQARTFRGGLPTARFGALAAISLPRGSVQLAARWWQGSPVGPPMLILPQARNLQILWFRRLFQSRSQWRARASPAAAATSPLVMTCACATCENGMMRNEKQQASKPSG
ncbi:hypothetical protein [Mesorhizobium sp. M6A.T.Cr.TU.017.01.1.1]|uniref:hypothetical protein n=1 Tax=Mesorhizobium sp. M6A.T.Cr.TU.017.01.1.1 TaxID=2496774 RepID=UPI001FE09956|nr:hypothetical protein [Mesorhizobium sp. M6A.T.Cr.TU.017.01.1.1]